jgi:hypothetical protein
MSSSFFNLRMDALVDYYLMDVMLALKKKLIIPFIIPWTDTLYAHEITVITRTCAYLKGKCVIYRYNMVTELKIFHLPC